MKALTASLLIIISLFLLHSCDTTEPNGNGNDKPPGYQEDIPWPSLADSPWPMYHHDPQSTGRSQYKGPAQGIISDVIPASQMEAGISIGYNSTIYYTASGEIFSSDYEGNISWRNKIALEISATPLVGRDSTIYVSTGSLNSIYAFNKNGSKKWEYNSDENIWTSTLCIDKEGNIYFLTMNRLSVLNKNGDLIWQLSDERIFSGSDAAPAFSPDGKTIYLQGISSSLLAVCIDSKSIQWSFGNRILRTGPVIDNEGNIYIFPESKKGEENYFYSLKPNGEIRWKFKHEENHFHFDNVEPAIDKYGNIYFGFHNLYSLNYEGELRWKVNLGDFSLNTAILTDNEGNIFFGASRNLYDLKIFSFNNKGQTLWEIVMHDERTFESSAAISDNGKIIFPTFRSNNFYIIK